MKVYCRINVVGILNGTNSRRNRTPNQFQIMWKTIRLLFRFIKIKLSDILCETPELITNSSGILYPVFRFVIHRFRRLLSLNLFLFEWNKPDLTGNKRTCRPNGPNCSGYQFLVIFNFKTNKAISTRVIGLGFLINWNYTRISKFEFQIIECCPK